MDDARGLYIVAPVRPHLINFIFHESGGSVFFAVCKKKWTRSCAAHATSLVSVMSIPSWIFRGTYSIATLNTTTAAIADTACVEIIVERQFHSTAEFTKHPDHVKAQPEATLKTIQQQLPRQLLLK